MEECYIVLPYIKKGWHIKYDDKNLVDFFTAQYGKYVTGNSPVENQCHELTIIHRGDSYRVMKSGSFDETVKAEKFPEFWGKIFLQNVSEDGYCYLHGGAIEINNKVFLFLGKSFSGKSTLITYLTAKGAAYITDDRLIVNTKAAIITPLTRRINLREGTKELLKTSYDLPLENMEYYEFYNYKRWRYLPPFIVETEKKVECAFLLERDDKSPFKYEECDEFETLNIYMENSLSLADIKDIDKFIELSKTIKLYKLYYSSLDEVGKKLLETNFV